MFDWLGSLGESLGKSSTWMGSKDSAGLLELGMKAGGGYMDYQQANTDMKNKLKMYDKTFGAEQNQLAFQNAEYLKKKKAEEDAWSGYSNPYATTMV